MNAYVWDLTHASYIKSALKYSGIVYQQGDLQWKIGKKKKNIKKTLLGWVSHVRRFFFGGGAWFFLVLTMQEIQQNGNGTHI